MEPLEEPRRVGQSNINLEGNQHWYNTRIYYPLQPYMDLTIKKIEYALVMLRIAILWHIQCA